MALWWKARRNAATIETSHWPTFFAQKAEIKDAHPHIVEWFDGTNCRATKTDIIENCFKKTSGVWKLDLEKPFFTESKKRCVGSRGAYVSL